MEALGRAVGLAVVSVLVLAATACASDRASSSSSVVSTAEHDPVEFGSRINEALAVATAFTEARSELDIEKMSANSIEGFINGLVVLSLAEMPAEFAWQEAVGWNIEVEGCEVTEADETTPTVRCDVSHSNSISEWLGVGPYPGAYHIKVLFAGDEFLGVPITRTSVSESHQTEFPILDFTVETWRPFVKWLEEAHPDDVDLMLGSPIQADVEFMIVAGERRPLLTAASTALWSRYAAEFAAR